MLDIKRIREDADSVKKALAGRGKDYSGEIDSLIDIDKRRRALASENDNLKAQQNKKNKEIPVKQKAGEDCSAIFAELKSFSATIKQNDAEISELEAKQRETLLFIPNTPDESVPIGTSDADNVEIKLVGEPKNFEYDPLPHWEIGKNLGLLDPERAGKVTGARFHFYKGLGAALERAVINFYLDTHTQNHGYTEIIPPYIVNADSMTGTGQLPKFKDDAFKLEGLDYYLIPTAEVPVTNLHRDEILTEAELPLRYCAYSACFRSEAGAAGRDTRGLIRQHQFQKVELVKFTTPEQSFEELEMLTRDAERCLEALKLPYRRVLLCSGDMGASSAKTYDIEVWLPSYGRYAEISSCSNFIDYQARRMAIRYRTAEGKTQLVHTLNGSGLAVGRTTAAILENYQNGDGSVSVPEVLQKYVGTDIIR